MVETVDIFPLICPTVKCGGRTPPETFQGPDFWHTNLRMGNRRVIALFGDIRLVVEKRRTPRSNLLDLTAKKETDERP